MRYAHYWRTAIKVLFIYFNLCLSVKMDSLSCTGNYVRSPCRVRFYYWIYSFTILSFFFCCKTNQTNQYAGADPGFQVRGAHLKKLRRAEGGAKILGVFRVKNHDFMPKNHIFSNFRGGGEWRTRRAPFPPWIRPWYEIKCM
jgi:hypothetical protein